MLSLGAVWVLNKRFNILFMALNTVELSSFITEGLGLAQPFNIQAGTLGCFFCNLMAFHGKHLCPAGSFALGPSKLFTCPTLWHQLSLVVRAFSSPALHHHFLDAIFQPLEVYLNVQISPSRTQGSLHLLCSYRVTRHSLQSKPLFLSSGRWFPSETLGVV